MPSAKLHSYPDVATIRDNPIRGLELECDVLIPAALEQQVTRHNAQNIRAKVSIA